MSEGGEGLLDKTLKKRYNVLYFLIILLLIIALWRLFLLQVIDGTTYRNISDSRLSTNIPIKAPRGEILDRYGRPLVTNRVGYSVSISKDRSQNLINSAILNLVRLFEEKGLNYEDSLPISKTTPFAFTFLDNDSSSALEQEEAFKKNLGLSNETDVNSVIKRYKTKYEFDESYTDEEVRIISGVRFEMEKRNFSSNNPYLFAEDVDIETISQIKERHDDFSCVTVYTQPVRQYSGGTTAAHILGRIGIINAKEYETLKNQGYGMNDYLGKQGVEKAFEKYLRGTDGVNSIEQRIDENENKIVFSKEPRSGDTVLLTIDKDLQKLAEKSLKENIAKIASTSKAGSGNDANSGAAVAIDLNSGEILAIASYPTYDPERFNQDYAKLLADPLKPMFNRALNGTYEPGSTYKLSTALAALETNATTPNETIRDLGIYKYLDHEFMCSIYRSSRQTHGTINISQALQYSCNYFFFEMGRRLGIDKLNEYSSKLGLGEYTGIELESEEAKGQLASPENREKNGLPWYPGDVLQAAIGQSDNIFTPLQIANFVATIANGGTHYEAHLLKAVKSNEQNDLTMTPPKVRNQFEIKKENLIAILNGMQLVTSEGTARSAFADFPLNTGGKTGSAQVSRGSSNGIYVGFAPFDDPQIAVAVVIEHGGSGGNASFVARDIFYQYFFSGNNVTSISVPDNCLLQ